MAAGNEMYSLNEIGVCLGSTPHEAFSAIKRFFNELRIFGEMLSFEHDGISYRVWCDEQCFMVYRTNDGGGSFHHVPGWPVCLVTSHTVYEECSAPSLTEDHHTCRLDILRWLEVVAAHLDGRETVA